MIPQKDYSLLEPDHTAPSPSEYNYANDPTMQEDLPPVYFWRMFRFADKFDYLLLVIGLVCAALNGVSLMFYANPYGQLTESFAPNVDKQWIVEQTKQAMFGFLKNSVLVFFGSWFMSATWTISSERQSIRCRKEYLRALLRQEPAWHDRKRSTELAQKMYTQTNQLQTAIGNKISSFLMSTSMVIGGVIIALLRGWKMGLVLLGFVPVMLLAGAISTRVSKKADARTNAISTRLAGDALEVLENVRTVKVLTGEQYQLGRYERVLEILAKESTCYGWIKNFISSLCYFCVIMNYTLGFWYGSVLVSRQQYNQSTKEIYSVADVIVIFFTIYTSNLNLGQIPDCIAAFQIGSKASAKMYAVMDRVPQIESGDHAIPIVDSISFQKITFHYDQPLFENVSFMIRKGKTAFVGESGSGKSTVVSLLMRFYDPLTGKVLFNQQSIKEFELLKLRESIGYVGQEPVLLGKTIREALIAENKQDFEIIRALKLAEAWSFVKDIGIDREYGMLSGGQKQRIAIARALLKNPQILILDEATSALDRRNQKQIQNTLNNLQIPFMVMVAHKIETVEKADYVYVLDKGRVVEEGTFSDLMMRKGKLYELAMKQRTMTDSEQASEENQTPVQKRMSKKEEEQTLQKKQAAAQVKEEENVKEFHWRYIWNMFRINSQKLPLLILGVVCTMYIGCVFPLFSFFISRLIVVLSSVKYAPVEEREIYVRQAQELSFNLLIVSLVAYLACALRGSAFTSVQERLTYLMKKQVFHRLLKMKISFFDKKGTAYCSTILSDVNIANKLGSSLLWDIFENASTLICGLGIAFISCWQMTLIALSVFPVLLLAGKMQAHFIGGFSSDTDFAYKKAHEKVVQALLNYKTVLSFNLQNKLSEEYDRLLEQPMKIAVKRGNIAGISFGFAQALISCIFALIFFVGALLIRDRNISVLAVYTSIYAIMFSAMSAGGNLHFVSSIVDSKTKLINVMEVIEDEENQEITNSEFGLRNTNIRGDIELRNVTFRYPMRETPVFTNLSLKIEAGTKVALVGSSGCGKSTVVGLLLRVYSPESGVITIDSRNIADYELYDLRSRIGVVSQEPALFNRTVYENIKYNRLDVHYAEVEKAAVDSNAYQFIMEGKFGIAKKQKSKKDAELTEKQEESLQNQLEHPQLDFIKVPGFQRRVGIKGGFLSGGQKQRIAIARTLVRKPQLMLLDEATSALDTKNEQLVQEALERINGVTQVIVAHRLSTIKKCDKIIVFDRGVIVEEGRFGQLIEKRGFFYRLAKGDSIA